MTYGEDASNSSPDEWGADSTAPKPSRDAADEGFTPSRFRDPANEPQLPLGDSLRPRGPVQLRIAHHPRGEATVVTVAGELDILTAARFSAFVGELVRRQVGDLLIDLCQARFVDSAGLQILLSAQRQVSRHARWLGVICPHNSPVRRVMELARLTEPLGVFSSFEEYERSRRGPGAAA